MLKMNIALVEQFAEANKSEKGSVYIIDDPARIASVLLSVCSAIHAKCVVVGALPDAIGQTIEAACRDGKLELLKAPFAPEALPQTIARADIGVTKASFAIASTGTVVQFTTQEVDRLAAALCWAHVCILRAGDIRETLADAPGLLRNFFAQHKGNCTATFITGPSRSADIEFKIQMGVHGPQQTHTIVLLEPVDPTAGGAS